MTTTASLGIARRRDQPVDEGGPLGLVGARREDLLELVDDEHETLAVIAPRERRLERVHRMVARPQRDVVPALAAGKQAGRERGQQAGHDHRGLAAARRADDAEQPRPHGPRGQLSHEALAAVEVRRVGLLERGQPLVGALLGAPSRPSGAR